MSSLEQLFQAATSPSNSGPDTLSIDKFCERVNADAEGPRVATRLLATKVQSTNEWEALQALHVLETCMKNCSGLLPEVAKFRFLNELIRVVSPKYLGPKTAPAVKSRVLEMLFSWTRQYPQESKIQEAFEMLRKQGVATEDHISSSCPYVPPRQTDKASLFEDDEKSKLLKRLLQSKHPDDLQAANRLIKSMVREDEKRTERQCKATSKMDQVQNNCQLLMEMLTHFDKSGASSADLELMAELKQTCETLRPTLSSLAEECADQEEVLNEIISAGDELGRVLDVYTAVIIRGEKLPLRTVAAGVAGDSLLDLGQDEGPRVAASTSSEADQLKEIFSASALSDTPMQAPLAGVQFMEGSLLMDAPLMGPKIEPPLLGQKGDSHLLSSPDIPLPLISSGPSGATAAKKEQKTPQDPLKGLDLDFLVQAQMTEGLQKKQKQLSTGDESLLDFGSSSGGSQGDDTLLDMGKPESLPDLEPLGLEDSPNTSAELIHAESEARKQQPQEDLFSNLMNTTKTTAEIQKPLTATVEPQRAPEDPLVDCKSLLADLSVSLTEIRPSKTPPVVVLDQPEGLHVSLHVAQNCPRPGVRVVVISLQSRLSQPLDSLVCQCAVPSKMCKVRLQPPSASELPAFSPFLPPPAATQIMLVANPKGVPVALKMMLSYSVDGDLVTELGEVDCLPLDA